MKTPLTVRHRWTAGIIISLWLAVGGVSSHGATSAVATAFVMNGFVVSINVTSGGSGYTTEPNVVISGGGGTGATAKAFIAGGSVVSILVLSAGSGYTSIPTVTVDAPLAAFYMEKIQMIPLLTVRGVPGVYSQIQYSENLDSATNWMALTNLVLPSDPYFFVDTQATSAGQRFYRILPVSELIDQTNPNPAKLVWVPAGTFLMGSPGTEVGGTSEERPQTQVTLTKGFWMGKFLVTQADYLQIMGTNPASFTDDLSCPVENVNWYDATNYCGKLNQQERGTGRLPAGYEYRLPTEAQWEFACRAGTTTRFYYGDDPNYTLLDNYAWYSANSQNRTHPVGLKQPNAWGLYDMMGNVWQICLDWYGTYPGGSVTDPYRSSGPYGVIRGNGWNTSASQCRSANRAPFWMWDKNNTAGFRVALVPVP